MKYCYDCKYFKRDLFFPSTSKCMHSDAAQCVPEKFLSPRYKKTKQEWAIHERKYGKCGVAGRNFEAKR